MEKARKEFPVLRRSIYTNTPVFGPIYDSLLEWRQEHDLDFLLKGSEMRSKSLEIISDTRTAVGNFFGCKRENVALLNNFSSGLNMLLEGLDKSQKVLLLENDYPSVDWPFHTRGFQISYTKIDQNLEENIRGAIQEDSISILALSVVQWQNGIKIDLNFLKELKKENPNLLIIADGTQFLGTTNFDFESSAFDVLGASAYKWLLSGYGNGFMLFKDEVKNRCELGTTGFNAANGVPDKKDHIRFARLFEPGHLSCLNFGSLKFSLNFLEQIGKDNIEAQNQKLSQIAKEEFTKLGLLEGAVTYRKEHSTIFNIKGDDALFEHLIANDVVCAQRGDGIRLGFHFFNTEKELHTIVRILKERL
jgi:cysteine desulfurase/selenocysteine lyase